MAKTIPSFAALSDTRFEGYFFKDEGSFLKVLLHKDTLKPVGDREFIEWGKGVDVYITKTDLKTINSKEELVDFIIDQAKHNIKLENEQ